jgi:Zn-dependent peptidase ImmA (M78 family)
MGFVFTHELGHAILHSSIKINNDLYNEFKDSEYDLVTDKDLLTNYKHWIEWQANKFASSILIPSINLQVHLVLIQKQLGIGKFGNIYLDNQPVNIQDFLDITKYLKGRFNASKSAIEYKLQELDLITYDENLNRRK